MKTHAALRLLISGSLAAGLAPCAVRPTPQPAVRAQAEEPGSRTTLRVGLWTLWHDRDLIVTPGQAATLRMCESCTPGPVIHSMTVRADGDSVLLVSNGSTLRKPQIQFSGATTLAAHGETLALHNPITIKARDGALVLIVGLPVEAYVERVVASESSSADSAESLKALAVVVRTYALHEAHRHADYDLCDSTHCQHLRWSDANLAPAEAATLATAGETLWFHGQRAPAYFSRDCGGHTASPSEIWPHAAAAAYLPAAGDPYCARSGGAEWDSEVSRADLSAALSAHRLAPPGWQTIAVSKRAASGRALALRAGENEFSAEEFRIAVGESLGWNKVPSTWFELTRQGDRFLFHGRGWGHGVGLCQKGAAAMAAQNQTYADILARYFPGADDADETTGERWRKFAGNGIALESLDAADAAYLPQLERARAEAAQRSGLNTSSRFTARAFPSTQAFRDATLSPGWVAAFTQGGWIATQPLSTLAERHLLAQTLRHEFLHALIEEACAPGTPLWLREGLAEAWGEDGAKHAAQAQALPAIAPDALDAALAHAKSEAESEAAHRAAGRNAGQLLDRYGRDQVLAWLRSGVPAAVLTTLGKR